MDQRLYVAACSGDVGALYVLLKVEPFILHTVQLTNSDTPLHIAALLGHVRFAKVALTNNPELAKELNHQGLSPVHLASLKGYLAIVIDLLNVDKRSCLLKDRDGRTPLHCAAIKGRLDVIRQLLECCPESATELTYRRETVLHLAVKNNQCETVIALLDILRGLNLADELVNCKDEDGNTLLHLATARKQHQIVRILSRDMKVSINAVNGSERTALDIAVICCLESDDMIIVDILRRAQGQKASECHIPPRTEQQISVVVSQSQTSVNENSSTSAQIPTPTPTPSSEFERELKWVKNGIIILCSLFATFSFEAALNPPGGLWQDWQSSNITNTNQIAKVKNITNSFFTTIGNTIYRPFLLGPIPQLNVTAADLYGPAKAMNIALAAYDFIFFLYFDAVCFTASLATVLVVMLTPAVGRSAAIVIILMTMLVLISAACLYYSVLALVTNEQFAKWAIKVGVTHLYVAATLSVFIINWQEIFNKTLEMTAMTIVYLCEFSWFLWRCLCKLYRFLRC